jgi:ribosome-associated translation inhibitor RaiA
MEVPATPFEYHLEGVNLSQAVQNRIHRRYQKWSLGHTDITGGAIAVGATDSSETPHEYRARVVLYHRPENIAGIAKATHPADAVTAALDAVERQLRETREVLRERWKRD